MTITLDTKAAALTALDDETLAQFRARAADADRDNTYFHEDLAILRSQGYLAAAVPEHLGGGGLSLSELAAVQRRLARFAPATALAMCMHHYWVGHRGRARTLRRHVVPVDPRGRRRRCRVRRRPCRARQRRAGRDVDLDRPPGARWIPLQRPQDVRVERAGLGLPRRARARRRRPVRTDDRARVRRTPGDRRDGRRHVGHDGHASIAESRHVARRRVRARPIGSDGSLPRATTPTSSCWR